MLFVLELSHNRKTADHFLAEQNLLIFKISIRCDRSGDNDCEEGLNGVNR